MRLPLRSLHACLAERGAKWWRRMAKDLCAQCPVELSWQSTLVSRVGPLHFRVPSDTILFRRVESTPDPDTSEKYRDTPPISIATLLQKYALHLAESSIYATNLYHDTPPICIAIPLQKYWGQGSLEHPRIIAYEGVILKSCFCKKL